MKDHLYTVGRGGLIFTSPWIVTGPARRHYATILLTARDGRDHRLDDLAAAVGLSYNRLSHLFAESLGVSLRVYQHWRKVRKAMTLFDREGKRPLTDIAHASGFTDSSHMCKAFVQAHGAPPSHFSNRDYVKIISVGRRSDKEAEGAAGIQPGQGAATPCISSLVSIL